MDQKLFKKHYLVVKERELTIELATLIPKDEFPQHLFIRKLFNYAGSNLEQIYFKGFYESFRTNPNIELDDLYSSPISCRDCLKRMEKWRRTFSVPHFVLATYETLLYRVCYKIKFITSIFFVLATYRNVIISCACWFL